MDFLLLMGIVHVNKSFGSKSRASAIRANVDNFVDLLRRKKAVLDRDLNAAQNILLKSTAGTAGSNAWGEAVYQCPSLNQEAPSVRAG